jgi:hypothetical protein
MTTSPEQRFGIRQTTSVGAGASVIDGYCVTPSTAVHPPDRGCRTRPRQGIVDASTNPSVMASKSDPIQINCKYEMYEVIHRSVVAAARRARQEGNDQLLMALRNALLTLGEA